LAALDSDAGAEIVMRVSVAAFMLGSAWLAAEHAPVNGVRLWFQDSGGSGPAMVLLHAATGSSRVWEHQTAALLKAGYRVIAYDLRGYGRTEATVPGPDADDLEGLLMYLKLDRIHLLGTAAGGSVALDYALRFPRRLRSLVVANSVGGVQDPEYLEMAKRIRPQPQFNSLPAAFRELGPSYRAASPEGTARWEALELASRAPGPRMAAGKQKNRITFEALSSIRTPVLLLTGDADLYMPPAVLRLFSARMRRAETVVVPDAGHSAYWENPDVFNRAVLTFIAKH